MGLTFFVLPSSASNLLRFFQEGAWWNATYSYHFCKGQLRFFRSFCITAPGRLISLKTIRRIESRESDHGDTVNGNGTAACSLLPRCWNHWIYQEKMRSQHSLSCLRKEPLRQTNWAERNFLTAAVLLLLWSRWPFARIEPLRTGLGLRHTIVCHFQQC